MTDVLPKYFPKTRTHRTDGRGKLSLEFTIPWKAKNLLFKVFRVIHVLYRTCWFGLPVSSILWYSSISCVAMTFSSNKHARAIITKAFHSHNKRTFFTCHLLMHNKWYETFQLWVNFALSNWKHVNTIFSTHFLTWNILSWEQKSK